MHWRAIYKDGTFLNQYNENGIENKYTDIDRSKLEAIEIWHNEKLILRMHLEEGRRLILRRRVIGNILNPQDRHVIWLIGWQMTVAGKNVQNLIWLFEDDLHIEVMGNFKHCPYNEVILLDCEKER